MQVPWPPRLVALAAAALGLDVSLTLGVVAAGQVAQWWTAGLTTGHLMAGFALGAVLCALLMPDSRRFIVAYASFTSAILVALPAILVGARGGRPDPDRGHLGGRGGASLWRKAVDPGLGRTAP
jgi:hypothetical protein